MCPDQKSVCLLGGRPYKKLKGLGMKSEDAVRCCKRVYGKLKRTHLREGHPPYPIFKQMCLEALDAENRRTGM